MLLTLSYKELLIVEMFNCLASCKAVQGPSLSTIKLSESKYLVIISHVEIQNQVFAVHASVSSASIFPRTKAVKQENFSGLTD